MIQTKTNFVYTGSPVPVTGKLLIKIVSWEIRKNGIQYNLEDSILLDSGAIQMFNSRSKFIAQEEINQMDQILMRVHPELANLPKFERDWEKVRLQLLPFVQNDLLEDGIHTIYERLPSDFEYSPVI